MLAMSATPRETGLRDYGHLPLVFETNQGQADSAVKFLARAGGGTVFLTEREAVMVWRGAQPVRMRLAGARKPDAIAGLEATGGVSNYFLGKDPAKWHTAIPQYGRVEYKGVYAGVDVVYYGNPRELEYDLIVAPGADPQAIQLEYEGVESLRTDADGDLVLKTASGELRQKRPVAYQETAQGRVEVAAAYRLKGKRVTFDLAGYDARRRLVIDPVFVYSTYLGGSGDDRSTGIAVDTSGNAYVVGSTSSTFPLTNPLQTYYAGGAYDVFVTKINPAGSARVYSTYLGGSGTDVGYGIAVVSGGNAYVTGSTNSPNFPIANSLQTNNGGSGDAFVTKINAAGSAMLYSSYLGGSWDEIGYGIAVDGAGSAYVTGFTSSTNFPIINPLQISPGNLDAFVTKINPTGSAYVYSTYLGSSGVDIGYGIAVDGAGNAYVTGFTESTGFPTTNAMQPLSGGSYDAFVTKIDATGSSRVYSTYLGGSGADIGHGIAVDSAGNAYVTGWEYSTNFPTTNPLQASQGGNYDAFVTKINAAGSARVYSTYLGGRGDDVGQSIAVDGVGNAYVTGSSDSTNFPTSNPLQATYLGGGSDAFVAKINNTGSALSYSTYLGGYAQDTGYGVAVDGAGNAYVAGLTSSGNFPVITPIQGTYGGGIADAFILSISPSGAPCSYQINPLPSTTAPLAGGSFNSGVAASSSSCIWTPVSSVPWIGLTSGAAGSGSGTVSYTIDANTGTPRTGALTIGNQVFSITQAGIAAGGINGKFIKRMYLDFLGRPADAAGLAFWTNLLETGAQTRAQVALSYFNSVEFKDSGLYIANAYTGILNRDPDYGGWSFWFSQIRSGQPGINMVNSIIASPEFVQAYGSLNDAQFIQLVYQNVLGRPADAAGQSFWLSQLSAGLTRALMMNSFITGQEYAVRIRTRQLANLSYLGFLARSPEPAGRIFWTTALDGGMSEANLVNNFILSPEYEMRLLATP
ncbi:MAG: SBBP repeat-containing protein [Bryobacteraceae bacterium]